MNSIRSGLPCAILLFIFGFTLVSCGTLTSVQTTIPTYPSHPLVPGPEKIVVANAFDVKSKSYRNSKEEQFTLLIEGATQHAADQIKNHSSADAEDAKGILVPAMNQEESMLNLIRTTNSTHGMFVTSFNAYFDQTHVDVTKSEQGKSREAFYDIVVEVNYALRSLEGLTLDTLISVRKFHSSRMVLSGLLAAGPSIVSNHDDAFDGVRVNVDQYLKSFFPGQENRVRRLYLTKDFKAIGEAIKQSNYNGALEASQRLTSSSDKKISATAYYICAVLAERDKDFESVRTYLIESLNRQPNLEVRRMMADYQYMPRRDLANNLSSN